MRRLLLAAVLLLATMPPLPNGAATSTALVITGEYVIEGGTHSITQRIEITDTGSLIIRNATVYFDGWSGCTFQSGAGSQCTHTITSDGAFYAANSTLDTHRWDGSDPWSAWSIYSSDGVIDVRDSVVQRLHRATQAGAGPAPTVWTRNVIQDGLGPVKIASGTVGEFTHNTVDAMRAGVDVADASPIVTDNLFTNGKDIHGVAIEVRRTNAGERLYDTVPVVRSNEVIDFGIGLRILNSWANPIENNTFTGNGHGAVVYVALDSNGQTRHPPAFIRNVFDGNDIALLVTSPSAPLAPQQTKTLDVTEHVFVNSTCHDIKVNTLDPALSLIVDARESWWGSLDGPQDHGKGCDAIHVDDPDATVYTSPWWTSPP